MEDLYQIELWLPIKGFEGLYEISDYGRIKTFHKGNKTKNKGFKIPGLAADGYHQVQLTRSDKTRSCLYVHRLVGLHFIANPFKKPKINHKDGNKLNNHYLNLEWSTQLENIQHAQATGLMYRSIIPLSKIRLMREAGYMLKEIAEEFEVSKSYIWRLLNKKNAASATN
jgi:hypothetical protein